MSRQIKDDKDTATQDAPQVWASFDWGNYEGLTHGKLYPVENDFGYTFEIIGDDEKTLYCRWEDCAYLDGHNWTRHTSPDPMNDDKITDAARTGGQVYWDSGNRIRACLAACEGIPTEALEAGVVADMREALREARPFIPDYTGYVNRMIAERVDATLAKLEK